MTLFRKNIKILKGLFSEPPAGGNVLEVLLLAKKSWFQTMVFVQEEDE